jgi:catechol 2,3-dioxygenase-like lactoylglutathione lyase family enzyme
MADSEFPGPREGFVITHFLVVSDQDRSRDFYRDVFGAKVVMERDPVIMKIANSWLILNVGGGQTDDKPTVTLAPQPTPTGPAPSSTSGSRTSPRPTQSGQPRAPSSSLSPNSMPTRSAPTFATRTVT